MFLVKILVTGGAGFIGSNFIRHMCKTYPEYGIVNLDALTYAGHLENLEAVQHLDSYRFYHGSITDRQLVDKIMDAEKIEVIVNFAAESHVDRSVEQPSVFVETNVLGTQVLLDAAIKYGIKKFVQISTDEVYGELGNDGLFTEDTPLAPNSPYSASKASADMLVRAYGETFGLSYNITRCSNNYGPYQYPEKLVPTLVFHALRDESLPIYGTGLNVRDWLHVEDHCRAVDLIIHQGRDKEVYNIGGNVEKTNLDIAKIILDELNKPDSLIQFVADRPGHDWRYALDASKIAEQMNWRPRHHFESGIRETIRWYRQNQAWCTAVLASSQA